MLMTVLFYGSASESLLSRHFNKIKPSFCLNEVVLSGRNQHKNKIQPQSVGNSICGICEICVTLNFRAVRNNPRKLLNGYVLELTKYESAALRSKLLTLEASNGKGSRKHSINSGTLYTKGILSLRFF